ncbi:MAG TPA: lipoyl(octanoyl) transferase [Cryomorphaceae bacterium]|nr:lipoyl(octanoyl) transferase [Cryomorphaceae bacterium]|tara:strand:- start:1425 stop:2141 length:717 start_codon:yes stop_codon:yes gene_type:complete
MRKVQFQDIGRVSFGSACDFQTELFQGTVDLKLANRKQPETAQETTDHFLFVEHPPVFTLGKSGKMEHLLVGDDQLRKDGFEFYPVNRGGDITYHGPGQVVGYPIIDLDHYFTDIHRYLRYLEEVIISTLADYELKAGRSNGETGVWLDEGTPFARKMCAMGVKASRWTTMHGFALNVNADLSHFDYIVPCGISDKKVTSLHVELGREVDLQEVKDKIKFYFEKQFDCQFIPSRHPFK